MLRFITNSRILLGECYVCMLLTLRSCGCYVLQLGCMPAHIAAACQSWIAYTRLETAGALLSAENRYGLTVAAVTAKAASEKGGVVYSDVSNQPRSRILYVANELRCEMNI